MDHWNAAKQAALRLLRWLARLWETITRTVDDLMTLVVYRVARHLHPRLSGSRQVTRHTKRGRVPSLDPLTRRVQGILVARHRKPRP